MIDGKVWSLSTRAKLSEELAIENRKYWSRVTKTIKKCKAIGMDNAVNDQERICIAYILSGGSETQTARILGYKGSLRDSQRWYSIFIETVFHSDSDYQEAVKTIDNDILFLAREIGIQRNYSIADKASMTYKVQY